MPTPLWIPKEKEKYYRLYPNGSIREESSPMDADYAMEHSMQNSIAPYTEEGKKKLEAERAARELRARASRVDRSKKVYVLYRLSASWAVFEEEELTAITMVVAFAICA